MLPVVLPFWGLTGPLIVILFASRTREHGVMFEVTDGSTWSQLLFSTFGDRQTYQLHQALYSIRSIKTTQNSLLAVSHSTHQRFSLYNCLPTVGPV
jgi:hypothetical protein